MSHVQSVVTDLGFTTTPSLTSITGSAGNTGVFAAIMPNASLPFGTPTDTSGNTWTLLGTYPFSGPSTVIGVWYCLSMSGNPGTLSVSIGSGSGVALAYSEFSGRSSTGIDNSAAASATGTAMVGPTYTVAANADVWAVAGQTYTGTSTAWTAGSGFTVGANTSGTDLAFCVEYANSVAGGSITPSFTSGSGNQGQIVSISFAKSNSSIGLALTGQQAAFTPGILVSSGGALIPYRGFQPRPGPGIGPESDLMFLGRRLSSNLVPNLNLALVGTQVLVNTGALVPNVAGSLTLALLGTQSQFIAGSLVLAGRVFNPYENVVLLPPQATSGVPASLAAIGGYQVSRDGALVLGLSLSNKSPYPIFVNLTLFDGTTDYFLASGATIPVGDSFTMTKSMPIQLTPGWTVRASATGLCDALMSVAEFSH